jgi:MFS family permease
MSLAAVGLAGLGLALDDTASWALVLPGSIAAGLGYGTAFPAWTIVGVERVPDERQGVASGLLVTTQEVGSAVGFAVMVAVAASVASGAPAGEATAGGYRWAILAAALIAVGGALAARLTPRGEEAEPVREIAPARAARPAAEAA